MSRTWQSVLLLTVVVSQLLLGVHGATHPPAGQVGCEICSAYGDPIDNVPIDEPSPPAPAWTQVCAPGIAPVIAGSHARAGWPRAPPVTA